VADEVLRFDGDSRGALGAFIEAEQREELCAWVSSLGADPARVLPRFCITSHEGTFRLHLSVKVRNDNGRDVLDRALNTVWSEPLVIDLGSERCWPKWLHDTQERSDG
jgi:hypothetical protein